MLVQKLFDQAGKYLGSTAFELGTIEAGKAGKVSFGLTVPKNTKADKFTTAATVYAEAPDGSQVTSETAGTNFSVRVKIGAFGLSPETALAPASEILGTKVFAPGPMCQKEEDIWVLVMLAATSSVLFANKVINKDKLWLTALGAKRLLPGA